MQYQFSLPMQFRVSGEKVWHDAWTNSMSLKEIVFRADITLKVGKTVNIQLFLPSSRDGQCRGMIVSKAKVTRSWFVSEMPKHAFTVAALTSSRILRPDPANSLHKLVPMSGGADKCRNP